jgi:hypothetical protein
MIGRPGLIEHRDVILTGVFPRGVRQIAGGCRENATARRTISERPMNYS